MATRCAHTMSGVQWGGQVRIMSGVQVDRQLEEGGS